MKFLIHDGGRILNIGYCSEDASDAAFAHFTGTVLKGIPYDVSLDSHYVDDGQVKPIPPKPGDYHEFDYAIKQWAISASALTKARSDKEVSLRSACRKTIIAGFTSRALGEPHIYPSAETDQANLIASVTASMYPNLPSGWTTPFLCMDAAGDWDYRAHTAAQIQAAGADGKAAILASLQRKAMLFRQVELSETIEAVEAIAW